MDRTAVADRELISRTRPFALQQTARSWWHVATTFGALAVAVALAAAAPWWPLRVAGGVLEALVLVRAFILYHDFMHGALLAGSRLARGLFHTWGVLVLTPARVWNDTHNYHHANTARMAAASSGTYVTWTTDTWRSASRGQRLAYRAERHPLTMLFGYVTCFLLSMCLVPALRQPRRYWTSALALLVHAALSLGVWHLFGAGVYLCALLLPLLVAYALGTYLFFAQHNFPEVVLRPDGQWTHVAGALEASSYLECGPLMRWFTGNIGYHHVHHLNPRIPFYRLPEAMAALPELQQPRTTSLHPRDVLACLRMNLWDPAQQRMVRYAEVRLPGAERAGGRSPAAAA